MKNVQLKIFLFLVLISTILLGSCKKKELKEKYQNYKGKWSWHHSEYTQTIGGGTTQVFDDTYYYYEFLDDFKVKIWSNNALLLEGEMIDIEITNVSIAYNIAANDGATYKSDFQKIDEQLWQRKGGPGPKSPVAVFSIATSYFKKTQ